MCPLSDLPQSFAWIALLAVAGSCGNSAPTKGRIPSGAMQHDGTMDANRVPDFVVSSVYFGSWDGHLYAVQ